MPDVYEELKDWSEGIFASTESDRIPNNSSPKAWNTAFVNVGDGLAVLGTRPGLVCVNETPLSGTPEIHHQQPYSYESSGSFSNYQVVIGNNGKLYYKTSNDTISSEITTPTSFPFTASTCFATGAQSIDGTVMNNRVFLANDAGERRSLVDQTHKIWGGDEIASWVPARLALGGTSAMPTDTYDLAITTFDATTGRESNLSATQSVTTTVTTDRITVTISPTAAEIAQNPSWRVYLRRTSTQSVLYQVQRLENSGGTDIVTDGNIPIATTVVYVDLSSAEIADHIILAPTTTENSAPPTSIQYVKTFGRRLVCADKRSIYWSKLDKPDSFPPENTETIDTGEGDEINGLMPFSDDLLLIFTRTAVLGLYGNDPQYWVLKPVNTTIGCSGHKSIVQFDGRVGWWSDVNGPVMFDGQSIIRIALERLGNDLIERGVNGTRLSSVQAGWNPESDHVVWAVSEAGNSTRNTFMLPFNYRLNKWESSKWDPMDAASLSVGYNANQRQRLFLGGYLGQLFYFDDLVKNDGVPSGDVTGGFSPLTSSITTIEDTGATFYTTGAGLTERYVTVTDDTNNPVARKRITSATATVMTLESAIDDLTVGGTYNYYIGGPDFRIFTKHFDMGQAFLRKRFDRVYVHLRSESGSSDLFVSTQLNFDDEPSTTQNSLSLAGDLWDTGVWDTAVWSGTGLLKRRIGVWQNAHVIQIAVYHFAANVDVALAKIAITARVLSDRYYG